MILVIDNYDSFVHNLARYFALLGTAVRVVRNDAIAVADIATLRPRAVVLSPGPRTPAEAGISCDVLRLLSGRLPILGVCLGHQAIGTVFGGRTVRARHPLHGQASAIHHGGTRLFAGLPEPMVVGRYHSLIVEGEVERDLLIDARSAEGEIMALSHRRHPTYGVQFHPESVLTPDGLALLGNFLRLVDVFHRERAASEASEALGASTASAAAPA